MSTKKKDLMYSTLIVLSGLVLLLVFWVISRLSGLISTSFFGTLFRYDAVYYDIIVKEGYVKQSNPNLFPALAGYSYKGMNNGMSNYPFFPLFPFIVRGLYYFFGKTIAPNIIGCLFSIICLIAFLYVLIRYLRKKNINIHWVIIAILFVFNQSMIYFYSFYTESIFMLLAMLVIYFSDDEKFVLAGIVGAIFTATRINGAFFIFYLFFRMYQYNTKKRKEQGRRVKWYYPILDMFKEPKQIFSLAVFPLGLAFFMLYLNFVVKLPVLAFMDIQTAWGKEFSLISVRIVQSFLHPTKRLFQTIYVILCLTFMIILLFRKRYLSVFVITVFSVCTIFTSFASYDRYIIGMLLLSFEFYYMMLDAKKIQNKSNKKLVYALYTIILLSILAVNIANLACIFFMPGKSVVVY